MFLFPKFLFGFRESQTGISIYWMVKEGLKTFDYITPIFGPPWQVPLEFPTFQICASLLSGIFHLNVDYAARFTSLGFFYLSILPLYFLAKKLAGKKIAFATCILYLLVPFNAVLSISGLIETSVVFFGLSYLYFFSRAIHNNSNLDYAVCLTFGILAFLTKITFIGILLLPLACFYLKHIFESKQKIRITFSACFLIVLPFIIFFLFLNYSDEIKQANAFTMHLTSENLKNWNTAYPGQRTFENYFRILKVWQSLLLPNIFILPFLATLCFVFRSFKTKKYKLPVLILLSAASCFVVITLFFNLYRHHYYYFTLSPFTAFFLAYGAKSLFSFKKYGLFAFSLFLMVSIFGVTRRLVANQQFAANKLQYQELAEAANRQVSCEAGIVSEQEDWYSDIIFTMKRKGIILSSQSTAFLPHADVLSKIRNYKLFSSFKADSEYLAAWPFVKLILADKNNRRLYLVDSNLSPVDYFPVYNNNSNIEVKSGNPYGEIGIDLPVDIYPGTQYKISFHVEKQEDSRPFLILFSDMPNKYLIHNEINIKDNENKKQTSILFVQEGNNILKKPRLILRNWSTSGECIFSRIQVDSEKKTF
jgi:hypothetical protein